MDASLNDSIKKSMRTKYIYKNGTFSHNLKRLKEHISDFLTYYGASPLLEHIVELVQQEHNGVDNGDSLPYPKVSKEQLDYELDDIKRSIYHWHNFPLNLSSEHVW